MLHSLRARARRLLVGSAAAYWIQRPWAVGSAVAEGSFERGHLAEHADGLSDVLIPDTLAGIVLVEFRETSYSGHDKCASDSKRFDGESQRETTRKVHTPSRSSRKPSAHISAGGGIGRRAGFRICSHVAQTPETAIRPQESPRNASKLRAKSARPFVGCKLHAQDFVSCTPALMWTYPSASATSR